MDKKEIIKVIELLMSTPEHSKKHDAVIERAKNLVDSLKKK